ncbi:VOC family protein [Haloferacaceae archaeon DSL9]
MDSGRRRRTSGSQPGCVRRRGHRRRDGPLRPNFGVESWDRYRFEPPALTETTDRGDDRAYSMILALAFAGDTMLELIEPPEGPSPNTEHLDEHGEGLHRTACFSDDDTEGVVAFEDAGGDVIQSGVFHETPTGISTPRTTATA